MCYFSFFSFLAIHWHLYHVLCLFTCFLSHQNVLRSQNPSLESTLFILLPFIFSQFPSLKKSRIISNQKTLLTQEHPDIHIIFDLPSSFFSFFPSFLTLCQGLFISPNLSRLSPKIQSLALFLFCDPLHPKPRLSETVSDLLLV